MKPFHSRILTGSLVSLLAAGALLAQPPAGLRAAGGPGRGAGWTAWLHGTVTGAPFSATETRQSQRTLANGSQIQNQQQSSLYRDSQGRVRIDTTITPPATASGGSTPRTMSTIYDPVAGFVYRLNPAKMTAVKSAIPQRPSPTSGTPPARTPRAGVQVQTQSLGTSTVNGVTATGTQVTTTIAAGTFGNTAAIQAVRVTWVSTALQIPVQITVSDPRSGNSTMNVTNIVQASPNESLFQVPPGYTVTTASARSNRAMRMRR